MERFLALLALFILFSLIIATFTASILNAPAKILFALIFCDVIFPILIYVLLNIKLK